MLKVFPAVSAVSSVSGGFRGLPLMERGRGHTGQLFVVYVNVVVCKDTNCYFQNLLGFALFMMNAFYNFYNIFYKCKLHLKPRIVINETNSSLS